MALTTYQGFRLKMINGTLPDLTAPGDVRCMAMTNAYTPNIVTDVNPNDITASECSRTSYARQDLAGVAVTWDAGNVRYKLDVTDFTFGILEAGETLAHLVYYIHVTDDTDGILIGYDNHADVVLDGTSPLNVTVDADGLIVWG